MQGIKVSEEVMNHYKQLSFRKLDFMILKLNDDKTEVIIDYISNNEDNFDTFIDKLPEDEPRYALYDYKFKTNEELPRNVDKILFYYWCPEASKIFKKLPYTANKGAVLSQFKAVFKDFEVSSINKLDEEQLLKMLQKFS